jgi:hypothetical protein
MATRVDTAVVRTGAAGRGFMADQRFFTAFAAGVAAFIVLGFVQFQLRGYANFRTAPAFLHLHGGLRVSWLMLFVAQSVLVSRGQIAVHRKTGWLSLVVAAAVVAVGSYTGIHAIATGRVPPFFTPAFFMAVNQIGIATFALVVILAVAFRRQVQWHRRLMVGSGILLTEPALGRLLPMPLLGQSAGELLIMVVQLGLVAVIARHDRKVLGQVHPATLVMAAVLVVSHLAVELAARLPVTATLAQSIAAG